MKCPLCGQKVGVMDTVYKPLDNEILRRRQCLNCTHELFTIEFEVEPNEQFKKEWRMYHRNNINKNEDN